MKTFDLSFNLFEKIPLEVGNLELLKDLHEWEISVGVLQKLTEFDMRNCFLTSWPLQLEKIKVLELLNLSFNQINNVDKTIGESRSLKHLDISHNFIPELPVQFYGMQNLKVSNILK